MKKQLFYIAMSFLLLSCSEEIQPKNINGALEALQLSAQQKLYPNLDQEAVPYFREIEKFKNANQLSNREDLPDPWEAIGPHNIAGRALSIAINPQNNNTLYLGSASGGLWRSYNKGKGISWEQVELGFPVLGVSSISFASNDSMTMYIGTGEVYNKDLSGHGAAYRATRGTYGMGILKSTDGGVTWTKSLDWSYGALRGIHVVKVAPSNSNVVYAGTTHGTYKSLDAGATWKQIQDTQLCTDLVIHPDDENDVVIACGNFGSQGKGLYYTRNGGTTWDYFEPNNFQGKIQLAQYEENPQIVYASIGNGFGFSDGATWVFKTTNRGTSWTLEGTTDYSQWQGWFAHDIAVHPFDPQKLTLIGIEIYQSEDGGKNANQITIGGVAFGTPPIGEPDGPTNFTHSDHHDVIYDRKDANTIYVANDGGLYGSFDGGGNWQSLNGGLQTAQFYNGFSVFPDENKNFAMGGLQDNSTIEFTGSKAWNRVIGGDGSWSALDPRNSDVRYGSLQNLRVFKATTATNYLQVNIPGSSLPTSFIAPFVVAPSAPDIIYAGRSNLYKSENGGTSFATFEGINNDFALSMDVSPTNPNYLYVATAPNLERPKMYVTKNGGSTINDITEGLPDLYINDIHVNTNDPEKVYITCGGFGESQVFRSDNGGDNWIDITSNLPKIPTSAIITDPLNDSLLYVGNDFGIFYSENNGESWSDFGQGIIDAALIMDLKINPDSRQIYAATHGSGAFIRDMIQSNIPSATSNIQLDLINLKTNIITESLVIEGLHALNSEVNLSIYSIDGKVLYKKLISNTILSDAFEISTQGFPNGQFHLNIRTHGLQKSLPFQVFH